MNINDDWDVEKHKTEHECDEHWELRRKFMLAHKKKFPEDELVCLAQVFSNIELLGCRYPKETMDLVAELSEEVAAEYREKQKTKLQRTFVKASEAASSKVKEKPIETISNTTSTKLESETKMTKATRNKRKKAVSQCRSNTSDTESLPEKKIKNTDLPYGDIVLVERLGDDIPQSILSNSVNISGNRLEWKCTQKNQSYDCTIYINSTPVACASGSSRKNAKKEVAVIALDELRKHYFTIKIKQNLNAQTDVKNVNVMTIEKTKLQDNIPDDNVGKKLLKLMGWSGGGLGKSQQGIMEPVMLKQQLSRKGLGLKSSTSTSKPALLQELKAKCKEAFKELLMGDTENDIVFSTDFTNDERAMIHQVARSMGLKSRSYGPSDQRRLVISRKIDIRSLVEELKALGGITEKYELIEPTT